MGRIQRLASRINSCFKDEFSFNTYQTVAKMFTIIVISFLEMIRTLQLREVGNMKHSVLVDGLQLVAGFQPSVSTAALSRFSRTFSARTWTSPSKNLSS